MSEIDYIIQMITLSVITLSSFHYSRTLFCEQDQLELYQVIDSPTFWDCVELVEDQDRRGVEVVTEKFQYSFV